MHTGSRRALAALGLALAAPALAQHGTWTWQSSTDAGATWREGRIDVPADQTSVRVRAIFGWTPDAGYAFGGAVFDAVITGLDGAGASDTAINLTRPWPMWAGASQTLAATRFGDRLKLDDSRDTLAPAAGSWGIRPGQLPEAFTWTNFSSANPAPIFQFDLALDGTPGTRRVEAVFSTIPTGQNPPVIRIFRNDMGASTPLLAWQQVTYHNVEINVLPAPGAALAPLAAACVLFRRRRR